MTVEPASLMEGFLAEPEGKTLEFKRDASSIKPILRTLVAFANTSGGHLVIGRDDAGVIVGVADPLADELRLANAIAHRDYSMTDMPIRLAIFSDRLEIESPGTLPHGMTVEQLKSGMSRPRNRVIARILRELDIMEAWGSGYRRMREDCAKLGHPLPEWQEVGPVIRTVFPPHPETLVPGDTVSESRDTINDTIRDTISAMIPAEVRARLNARQLWFLGEIAAGRPARIAAIEERWSVSTSTAKRDLKELQEKGLVEHVGPPKTGKWRLVTGPHGVRQDARAEHDD